MKRSILMLMAIAVALIFFGCTKEEIPPPDSEQDNLEQSALKSAKGHNKFEGVCTKVWANEDQNEWYDDTDDWRTNGTSIWEQPDLEVFGGTVVLLVRPNRNAVPVGKWEMTWSGSITPTNDGALVVAEAKGNGVEGDVKGMKAKWIYTMTYVGVFPPSEIHPPNGTFFYAIEGKINDGPVKRQGPK